MERSGRENTRPGVLPLVSLGLLGKLFHIPTTSLLISKMGSMSSLWNRSWDPLRKHLGEQFISGKSFYIGGFLLLPFSSPDRQNMLHLSFTPCHF